MDDVTRRHWEQIADRCFDRAYTTALNTVTILNNTTASDTVRMGGIKTPPLRKG